MRYKELLIAIESKKEELKEKVSISIFNQLSYRVNVHLYGEKISVSSSSFGSDKIEVEYKIVSQLQDLSIMKVQGVTMEALAVISLIVKDCLEEDTK
jgi:hypothetical protein